MARYKYLDLSKRFLAVDLGKQLMPSSFTYAAHHLSGFSRMSSIGWGRQQCRIGFTMANNRKCAGIHEGQNTLVP